MKSRAETMQARSDDGLVQPSVSEGEKASFNWILAPVHMALPH